MANDPRDVAAPSSTLHRRPVRFGPLEALVAHGNLRYLKYGDVELVRRIHVTVRDDVWGTVAGHLTDERFEHSDDRFLLRYRIEFTRGPIRFSADCTIRGIFNPVTHSAEVVFRLQGRALAPFATRRVGLCLLHPVRECVGRLCEVVHPDGTTESTQFPRLIDPRNPFHDVARISYAIDGATKLDLLFEGEAFETEDQRNWSDGSFKTFCRPLSKQAPYTLHAGEEVRQTITIRVDGLARKQVHSRATNVVRLGDEVSPLPQIGLCLPRSGKVTERGLTRLADLRPHFLRLDIDLSESVEIIHVLERAATTVRRLDVPIELGVHLSPDTLDELPRLGKVVADLKVNVARWIAYDVGSQFASQSSVAALRDSVQSAGLNGLVGGGTVGNFTELNRAREAAGSMPLLSYPLNPQMHGMDDLTIVENLESHADTVRTARSFAPNAWLAIGPITFHRRPDPFAMGKQGIEREVVRPDPRQPTGLAAAWTIGCIAELAGSRADSVALFEVEGPFGIMDAGRAYPICDVLAEVWSFGRQTLSTHVKQPLCVSALALQKDDLVHVLLGNLTEEPQPIQLS